MLHLAPDTYSQFHSPQWLPRGVYTRAYSDDLRAPSQPLLAEPGDWAADFNEAQLACYKGSMSACDGIWLSNALIRLSSATTDPLA